MQLFQSRKHLKDRGAKIFSFDKLSILTPRGTCLFLISSTSSRKHLWFVQVTLSEGQPRDLLDALLMGQMDCKHVQKSNECEDERITDDHVLMTAAETFGAGVETTSTTLLWILAYLLHHPEVKIRLCLSMKHTSAAVASAKHPLQCACAWCVLLAPPDPEENSEGTG